MIEMFNTEAVHHTGSLWPIFQTVMDGAALGRVMAMQASNVPGFRSSQYKPFYM